jgi:hypothetical protein
MILDLIVFDTVLRRNRWLPCLVVPLIGELCDIVFFIAVGFIVWLGGGEVGHGKGDSDAMTKG